MYSSRNHGRQRATGISTSSLPFPSLPLLFFLSSIGLRASGLIELWSNFPLLLRELHHEKSWWSFGAEVEERSRLGLRSLHLEQDVALSSLSPWSQKRFDEKTGSLFLSTERGWLVLFERTYAHTTSSWWTRFRLIPPSPFSSLPSRSMVSVSELMGDIDLGNSQASCLTFFPRPERAR